MSVVAGDCCCDAPTGKPPFFVFLPTLFSPAPSLLPSAIGNVSFAYWGSALALAIAAELVAVQRRKRLQNGPDGYRAGDLGLDPFGLADDEVSECFCCLIAVSVKPPLVPLSS